MACLIYIVVFWPSLLVHLYNWFQSRSHSCPHSNWPHAFCFFHGRGPPDICWEFWPLKFIPTPGWKNFLDNSYPSTYSLVQRPTTITLKQAGEYLCEHVNKIQRVSQEVWDRVIAITEKINWDGRGASLFCCCQLLLLLFPKRPSSKPWVFSKHFVEKVVHCKKCLWQRPFRCHQPAPFPSPTPVYVCHICFGVQSPAAKKQNFR